MSFKIYTDTDGDVHFPAFTMVGGYPLLYLEKGTDNVVCPYCAAENFLTEGTEYEAHPLFEGVVYCEDCGTDIIGAYEPDDDVE